MFLKASLAICLAAVCGASFAQADDDFEQRALDKCRTAAKELNKTRRANIRLNGLEALATWRAACAERPPTGPGTVTALCTGKRTTAAGVRGVFFWEMDDHGTPNRGYFTCTD